MIETGSLLCNDIHAKKTGSDLGKDSIAGESFSSSLSSSELDYEES